VGVEHAAPEHIRAALAAPRGSDPHRQLFSREDLLRWGLVADLHAGVSRCMESGIQCVTWLPASHPDHAPAWSASQMQFCPRAYCRGCRAAA
jgi:hypothetical protein